MKQKTYLDKLIENSGFKEKVEKEYQSVKNLEEDYQRAIGIIKKAVDKYTTASILLCLALVE